LGNADILIGCFRLTDARISVNKYEMPSHAVVRRSRRP